MPTSLRRCLSDVSMIIVRATNSGERAWREEYLKYVQCMRSNLCFPIENQFPFVLFLLFFFVCLVFFVWFSHLQLKLDCSLSYFRSAESSVKNVFIVTAHSLRHVSVNLLFTHRFVFFTLILLFWRMWIFLFGSSSSSSSGNNLIAWNLID